MAGIRAVAQTAAIATGTSAKTLLQLVAATNTRVLVNEWSIAFNGVSPSGEPIKVDVLRQTSAGTMSSLTIVKDPNLGSETLQTTAQHTAASGEPTSGDILATLYVHPQQSFVWQARFGEPIVINGGARLGLRVTAAASVSAVAAFKFEE